MPLPGRWPGTEGTAPLRRACAQSGGRAAQVVAGRWRRGQALPTV